MIYVIIDNILISPQHKFDHIDFGNTSFLTCQWIATELVGHTLIFSLLKLYDLFSKLFPMDPWCIQSPTLLEDHVNAISKLVCGTPIFNENI